MANEYWQYDYDNFRAQTDYAYLIQLARKNVSAGIIEEPRLYYDTVELRADRQLTPGNSEVFRNGESWPVRITHFAFAMAYQNRDEESVPVVQDERLIQRIGARFRFHDQFYMNEFATAGVAGLDGFLTPIPAWGNKVVAAAEAVSFSNASWRHHPWIYSARDTMEVDVRLVDQTPIPAAVPVTVTFVGVGMQSGRPYIFNARVEPSTNSKLRLQPSLLANDGAEPVMVTNTTVNIGNDVSNVDPTGDTRRVLVSVKQVGNGSGAVWTQGPVNDPAVPIDMAPGVLFGQQSGRAVIHTIPGQGLIWEKNEGIELELQQLNTMGFPETGNPVVHVAALGYVMVQ